MSRSRTSWWTRPVRMLLLALAPLATLVLAGPAVARPVSPLPHLTRWSEGQLLAVVGLAVAVAVALILAAVLLSAERREKVEEEQLAAARPAPQHRLAA